jgi:predicted MFS family arabinose efflux permease
MSQTRIRVTLFIGSSAIVLIVLVFLLILNINQSEELRRTFLEYLVILFLFSIVSFGVVFYKGAVFKASGELADGMITTVILTILIVVQITFAFANYAYRQMQDSFQAFDNARALYGSINWNSSPDELNAQLGTLPDNIDQIYILDHTDTLVYHYGSLAINDEDTFSDVNYEPTERYVFPFKNYTIGMHISRSHNLSVMRRILIDLSTFIITGLFFGFELILLVMQYIRRKIAEDTQPPDTLPSAGFVYIRQITFLFYFASRMASAFIPLLAAQLVGKGSTQGGIASSMPQSVETLLTCAAIFLTSEMIIRKGWKVPFLLGLVFVALGTFLSGIAASIQVFIAARAVVGLGYGFCWMTLRNLALFGRNDEERNYGFALLNAGLYAGMNCGSVMGSIMAESIGYKNVFFLAAGMTALCFFSIIRIQNAVSKTVKVKQNDTIPTAPPREKTGGYSPVLFFLLLLILPACILGAYTGYFMPIYVTGLGYGTADVGRAQLLYGLIIIYGAPKLSQILRKRIGDGIGMNVLYNLLLAAALIITGVIGGFNVVLMAILLIALGDGFGSGAQNNYFLAIPAMARLSGSRALSWLSFFKKLAEMAGPIVFAVIMNIPDRKGVLIMGIVFGAMAFIAFRIKKSS